MKGRWLASARRVGWKGLIALGVCLFVALQAIDLLASHKFYLLKGTSNKAAIENGYDIDYLVERIVRHHDSLINAGYYSGQAPVRAEGKGKSFFSFIPLPDPAAVERGRLRKAGTLKYKIPVIDVSLSDVIYFFADFAGVQRKELFLSVRCGTKCDSSDTYLSIYSAYPIVPIVFTIDDKRSRHMFEQINVLNPLLTRSDLEDRLVEAAAVELMGIVNPYRRGTLFINAAPDELPVALSANVRFFPDDRNFLALAVLAELNRGNVDNVKAFACFKRLYDNPPPAAAAAIAVASALLGEGDDARLAFSKVADLDEFKEFNAEFTKVFGRDLGRNTGPVGCRSR